MADAAASLPPPSLSIIQIAAAEIVIYTILLPPTWYITWKHGKKGMACWTVLISFYGMRFASDIWQIINRNEPNIPGVLLVVTNAGSVACLTLTIIGILYETNNSLPYPKRWTDKIIMGATNLANTVGIGLATYGGTLSAVGAGGVMSEPLNRIGNILMLIVMFSLYIWVWLTWNRVWSAHKDQGFKPALYMVIAAAAGLPFQLIRIIYMATYAFDAEDRSLDPVVGTFATHFVFLFVTQLGTVIAMVAGGFLGIPDTRPQSPVGLAEQGIELTNTRDDASVLSPDWTPIRRVNMNSKRNEWVGATAR